MDCEKTDDKLEIAFDAGEDMGEFFDFDNPVYPNRENRCANSGLDVLSER